MERTVPAELINKMARVSEAQKQLSLYVLTGKKFEKLEVQDETLGWVRSALETIKSKVKDRKGSGISECIFAHGVF